MTRRHLLKASGLAGAGMLLAASAVVAVPASPALAAPASLTPAQARLTLQIAAVGAVFPIPFPGFGETGPASSRITTARLRQAVRRLPAARLASVRSGLAALTGRGLLDVTPQRLLDGITDLAGSPQSLTAAVALAVATVSTHFDPGSDAAAEVWLDGLRQMRQHGVRPVIASTSRQAS
ncbi:hypothetical protein [Rugosimonospora africana]|uniref:Uncharacterized protein n=1 Tax=Rugosimonospora africana TaxID=556532 RepID=A0A8J3QTD7_9ACTN|nr:hypothetical protein [Rugosimonospora africana]GIH17115.1 hypothetical protein Raf01_52870 [Rugosimonospora africana]